MIVAFAGRIASGKSAVSRAVADHYAVDRVSFGDAVRTEAKRRRLGESRTILQEVGDELVGDGWDAFCARVIGQVKWDGGRSLVVDGVRHVGAVEALRRIGGSASFVLVFIETPWERRVEWLAERGVSAPAAIAADSHPNESELDDVMSQADLVVANNTDLDSVLAAVVAFVHQRGGLR